MADLKRLFQDVSWDARGGRFLPVPRTVSWQTQFDLPDGAGSLSVSLNQATRIAGGMPLLRLDFVANGDAKAETIEALAPWFELAHEWIVRGFADLTSPTAQDRLWGKENA